MVSKIIYRWIIILMAVLHLSPLYADGDSASNLETQAQFEAMLIKVLGDNPQIIVDAIQAYQQDQAQMMGDLKTQAMAVVEQVIKVSPDLPAMGASVQDAKVTLVEFFDYQCGFCKRFHPHLESLIEAQKDVRIVLMEMPILGPESTIAAKAALAAARQGQYPAYHAALMATRARISDDLLIKTAQELGMDIDAFNQARESAGIARFIDENLKLASQLQINGTPAFILGDEIFGGYKDLAELEALIANARTAQMD
ncbi:MAG: DsbA family protein [Alphaproteobacteria bacterium]